MCQHCQAAGDEDLLLICEMCDQAVHTTCMQPPLAKVPKTAWYCDMCTVCRCGAMLQPVSMMRDAYWCHETKGIRR